jgi:hypothetical protein
MDTEESVEIDIMKEIDDIFENKKKEFGIEAKLDLIFLDHPPIVGKFVYGEAFPFERPPRIRLEVVAIDATAEEITTVLCDELVHIKYPELEQYIPGTLEEREEFKEKIQEIVGR